MVLVDANATVSVYVVYACVPIYVCVTCVQTIKLSAIFDRETGCVSSVYLSALWFR